MNIVSIAMSILQIPTQEAAELAIGPHKAVLRAAIADSFQDWTELLQRNPEQTGGLSNYVRTRFVHDRTVHRLTVAETTGEHVGLRVRKIKGLWVVVLSDALILKLKKLTIGLRSRNIPTGQTISFDNQRAVLFAPTAATNATSGYVVDAAAASPTRFVVVCWDGPHKIWEVDLGSDAGGATGVVAEIPAVPTAPKRLRTKVVEEQRGGEQADAT